MQNQIMVFLEFFQVLSLYNIITGNLIFCYFNLKINPQTTNEMHVLSPLQK